MSFIIGDQPEVTGITLVTAAGNPIDNYRIFSLSQFERNQFNDYNQSKYLLTTFRCNPSPEYNCHGMSFASRRTNIDKATVIRTILADDKYKRIDNIKETLIGDIVLYVSVSDGDIMHSGTLVLCEHSDADLSNIRVLSKWGKYKEAIHPLRETGYKDYKLEFYRLTHEHYEL